MDSLLLFASSQRRSIRLCFALAIVALVAVFGFAIEAILLLNNSDMDTVGVRGGFFLLLFIVSLLSAIIFSKGTEYKAPAAFLLFVFMLETAIVFYVMSFFHGSQLAKSISFPLIYILGYFVFVYRDILTVNMFSLLRKVRLSKGYAGSSLLTTSKSVTSILIAKGLRYMAGLYTLYSLADIVYILYRDLDPHQSQVVSIALMRYNDLDYEVIGRYFMDGITLYLAVILLAGISKSIRENKRYEVAL